MKIHTKKNSLLYRFLTIVVYRTKNEQKMLKSPYNYGVDNKGYYLRILGVFHRWFKLALYVDDVSRASLLTPEELLDPEHFPLKNEDV